METLTVAGFVATTEQWVRIDQRWKAVLDQYGVSELHMKNYAHSTKEFSSWKGDERKRARFLADLIGVIQPRVRNSFACTIWLADYNEANIDRKLRRFVSPLALAGATCIHHAQRWARRLSIPDTQMSYVIEDGDIDTGNLQLCARAWLNVRLNPKNKKDARVLQTADLLAYEHFSCAKKIFSSPNQKIHIENIRKPLRLLSNIPCGKELSDWSFKRGSEFVGTLDTLREAAIEAERIQDLGERR